MLKGIILAGGSGTRLSPMTKAVVKQLLPVYDKPMIYYPLTTLMSAGIRDILIISTAEALVSLRQFFGRGDSLGIHLDYAVQDAPDGIAQAYIIAENYLDGAPSAMVLGDNLFLGSGVLGPLRRAKQRALENSGAVFFCKAVPKPERFGVLKFKDGRPEAMIEKPKHPPSPFALTGLYFFDSRVCSFAKTLHPSLRGELEITDLGNIYLREGSLFVETLGADSVWMDAGTAESLFEASAYVRNYESRSGAPAASPEMTAYQQGWISRIQYEKAREENGAGAYGKLLPQSENVAVPL